MPHPATRAMTLVDFLAGIAILAGSIVIMAPLATDARASQERTRLRLLAATAIRAEPPPSTPSGSRPIAAMPDGTLRWTTDLVMIAGSPGTSPPAAYDTTLQITTGEGEHVLVLAERRIPRLAARHPSSP